MNLPNSLTLLRIFFVPVLIVVLLTRSPNVDLWGFPMHFEFWGVLILLLRRPTDWADGYFARRNSQVTTLGILLDPIADKLLISAAFISLVGMHDKGGHPLVAPWMVVIIIGREFTILGLRNIASAEGFTIAASALGKTKMVLQVCAVAVSDCRRQASFAETRWTAFVVARSGERIGFCRTVLSSLLEPVGRPDQAAPQAWHAGSTEKAAGCPSLNENEPKYWRSRARACEKRLS